MYILPLGRCSEMKQQSEMARMADGEDVGDVITLLSSSGGKFLLSGKGYKVPISVLEGKVVGLYFYEADDINYDNIFIELKHLYKKLKKRGENFELVFICLHQQLERNKHDPEVINTIIKNHEERLEKQFMKNFKGMSWLALPFSQRKRNRKLYDLFSDLDPDAVSPQLVIIRPGENIAHTHAMSIYREYGIEAYPFAKSTLTEMEVARLKSLTLDSVLFSIGNDGQKIPASADLVGKNIIIFVIREPFNEDDCRKNERIYKKVIEWYNELKQKDEAFEMVRVFHNYDQSRGRVRESYNWKMPWLEFPYDKYDAKALCDKLLKVVHDIHTYLPMFLAFGRDGKFITMTSLKELIDDDDSSSPNFFDDVHLYSEVRGYIASEKMWATVDEETGDLFVPF